jgi:deoxyadenosine/deoxycytidine kinase
MQISIEGNVACGKSTLMTTLARVGGCEVRLEPVAKWATLLERFYGDPTRWALSLQLKVLTTYARKETTVSDSPMLIERSPISCRYVFGKLLTDEGLMQPCETETFEAVYEAIEPSLDVPSACIYVWSSPESCAERAAKRGRPEERELTNDYLTSLHAEHERLFVHTPHGSFWPGSSEHYDRVYCINGDLHPEVVAAAARCVIDMLLSPGPRPRQ